VAVDLRALVPALTGIGVYTRSLLLAAAPRQRFRYVGMSHRPPHDQSELAAAGVTVEVQRAPLGVLWQQLVLPRRLGKGDVDLLFSPLNTMPLSCPVPAVVTVHDLTAMLYPETHTAKLRLSLLPFLRPSLERAARLVAVSRATADDLAFHFPQCRGKIAVVYSGVDPALEPGRPEEIAAVRAELGAPDGYLLYVGTLEPRKNVDVLLDAWERLAGGPQPGLPLVVAGDPGWKNRHLARRLAALDGRGVRALGRVERRRLAALYQGARVFVYPSLYEGFGLPVTEALACGVPVVTSNRSSLPEAAGDAGVLVDPTDAGAVAQAIAAILGSPEREAELKARAVAQARRFCWQQTAREMEEVFSDALG
jgi:glycosyltransferase involved in cell wall biosynthesis